ncbi:MAG: NAD(P)H-hydrate dehydratase [Verrucomicrobiota bacterium]|nr:NAD(P)H-hydrate dehydratase [Verrucomicrobiota bacterium]
MKKVVLPQEAARVDRLAIESGSSEEAFVLAAGQSVARCAMEFLPQKVTLLIGKGNKGADGLAAGLFLARQGVKVEALLLFPEESSTPLNRVLRNRLASQAVLREVGSDPFPDPEGDLLIDALFGTGFSGSVSGVAETAIRFANSSSRPILAIDLPSGIDGATGRVEGVAIRATLTVALGFAKIGCFLQEGWNHTGELRVEDFGLPLEWQKRAEPVAWLPEATDFVLPPLVRNRHKYEAGYLVGFAGSTLFRGAPKLAGLAALRSGAGIVRIFHKEDIGETPWELISQRWGKRAWERETERASALFIGPGLGKGSLRWIEKIRRPLVLDADALQPGISFPPKAVLTPHRGEMARLLGYHDLLKEEELLERSQQFAKKHQVILLLKGAPTFLLAHDMAPWILTRGTPGMATAGTGDVLTGMIGAFLAQGMQPHKAAAFAAYLHGVAGEIAAAHKGPYGMMASDLIEALPEALRGKSVGLQKLPTH